MKEDLQALNEKLDAANLRLQQKVRELEAANNDLNNLIASSELATLCLDRALRIKWFTPTLSVAFNVMSVDVGRAVHELEALVQADLLVDAEQVLAQLQPVTREMLSAAGHWYLRRVLPYRIGDSIDGVMVTFADITASKLSAEAHTREREQLLASLERRVAERTAQLRAMAFEMIKSEEAERRAIARDLQDGLGQTLAIAKLKIAALRTETAAAAQSKKFAGIETLIDQCSRTVRSLAAQLCPAVLYDIGLVPALQWLADEMYNEHGLRCEISEDARPKVLDQSVRVILFRAARELLLNVIKHAQVKSAEVSIFVETTGHDATRTLKMVVRDNGKGFDPDTVLTSSCSGFGLLSVRERLAYIEGGMSIVSAPGKGTAVTLTIPLQ